jgi:tungstate transport system substrate-binding protein
VFVHAKSAEEKFLAQGEGVKRFPVMYNDFVLIGSKDTASITNEAVDELKLEKGKTAYAIIKATSVMVGVD